MNRPALNFLIDLVAFVAFALLTTTGILTRYVLPPGSGRWATLWGLDRHEWGDIHFWVAVVLLGVLALHLALHWRWILHMIAGRPSQASGARLALGAVGAAGLLLLAAAPLLAPVERFGEPAQRSRSAPLPSDRAPEPPAYPDAGAAAQPPGPEPGLGQDAELHDSEGIRGSMTLRQAAESAGVPLDGLLEQLRLPSDIDADERIGQMRKRIGISPDDVRRAVKEYRAAHP